MLPRFQYEDAGARIEAGEHKDDPLDFALWKAWDPEDGDVLDLGEGPLQDRRKERGHHLG